MKKIILILAMLFLFPAVGFCAHLQKHGLDSSSDHTGIAGTVGDFMSINANGLPADSGYKASSFQAVGSYESPLTFSYPITRTVNAVALGYNSTNLKLTTNQLDTIQGISTAASPTFTGLTLSTNSFSLGAAGTLTGQIPYMLSNALMAFTGTLKFTGNNHLCIPADSSGTTSAAIGTYFTYIQQNGNTANTLTTIYSQAIPDGWNGNNGDGWSFYSAGTFANTASVDKQVQVVWGGTTIFDTGALAITTANSWVIYGEMVWTGSTCKFVVNFSNSSAVMTSTVTVTTASEGGTSKTLYVKGKGTNANDVVHEFSKLMSNPSQGN